MVDAKHVSLFCEVADGHAASEIDALLARALVDGRRAWPTVELSEEAYFCHLASRVARGVGLETLKTTDLYLAAACASGSTAALSAFEQAFLSDIRAVARRASASVDLDDLTQTLREGLFVRRDGRIPKILEYSGRGDLRAWLRVVVTRTALNAVTRGPKDRAGATDSDQGLVEATSHGDSAELAYFRIHYEAEVKSVLPLALEALSIRERLYLRQHHLDELTLEEMGRLHGIHVATIKRHLALARTKLSGTLRTLLCERLRLSPSEFDSVIAVIQSEFHVTMRRLLPEEA